MSPGSDMLLYCGIAQRGSHGDFDNGQRFSFPGGSGCGHVGIVEALGDTLKSNTNETKSCPRVGDRVFSFKHHASHHAAIPEELFVIPDTVSNEDATFFPLIEAAVCIAHDAHPLPGESVCILGQGILGLLLCKVFRLFHPFLNVVTIEPIRRRRLLSIQCSSYDSLSPKEAKIENPAFVKALGGCKGADVVVEVSGQPSGYELSMRIVREHGKVVVGSYYPKTPTLKNPLKHDRVFVTTRSDASKMHPGLSGRWSKQRRYDLVWEVVKALTPYTTLGCGAVKTFDIGDCKRAYECIRNREYTQILFKY